MSADSPSGIVTLEQCTRRDRRIADARLAAFVVLVVLGFLVVRGAGIPLWWLALPGAIFVALILVHEPVRRAADRARRSVQFYSNGLARLDGRWPGTGSSGMSYLDVDHPYAADLDLFGTGSLFERLCTARTRSGEDTLAAWLLAPASPEEVAERQQAVRELRPQLDLREDLELLGVEVRQAIDPASLVEFGSARRLFSGVRVPLVAGALGVLGTVTLVGWLFFELDLVLFLFVLICDGIFARVVFSRVHTVLSAVERRTADLVLLSEILHRLETHPIRGSAASPACQIVGNGRATCFHPDQAARALLQLLDCRRNQLFAPFGAMWLWTTQIAVRIDAWRSGPGPRIVNWLAAIGEFEALCAGGLHRGKPARCLSAGWYRPGAGGGSGNRPPVAREARLRSQRRDAGWPHARVLIVSGSNMSGKSTLLRTVGHQYGAGPGRRAGARARRYASRRWPSARTLRIQDSLQAGRSRFYAEITRVRQLVELSRGGFRFSSCSTSFSTAPTRTTGSLERRASSRGCRARRDRHGHDP